MFKIFGIDDAVNTCDCCGKTGLKSTVMVDVDGEVLHYGSVCATRHTGLTDREIKNAIQKDEDGRKVAAAKKYESAPEYAALSAKMREAHRAGLVGKPFADFCSVERANATAVANSISNEFGGVAVY